MIYRPDIETVIERMKSFYASDQPGALIQIDAVGSLMTHMGINLTEWQLPEQLTSYLDHIIEMYEIYWKQKMVLKDDLIPALHPWFGIAELSAYIGGEVSFSEETSWNLPVVKDWSDLENLELREDNQWLRMVIDGMAYLKEKGEGKFAVMLRGAEGPMDVANTIRGDDFYTDLVLAPGKVHELMKFSIQAVAWFLAKQKEAVGDFYGGIITGFEVWVPGNIPGHIAEDASVMCSTEMYREFGLPYLKELSDMFEGILMHTHSAAGHNIPQIAKLPNVKILEITDDPNAPRAIELYKTLAEELSDVIVVLKLTIEELHENLEFLKGRRTIIKYQAGGVEDAQMVIDLVRSELNWQ